jgi:hypothetical protein
MMAFIRPRLRKPLGIALAGTVFAAAWALRGGHAWQLSVAMEVTVLVSAITIYVRAGEDNDEGALAGSRADERQKLLSLRSRALAMNFAAIAALHRPDDRGRGQGGLGVAVPGYSRRGGLWLSAPLVELRCRRRGPGR